MEWCCVFRNAVSEVTRERSVFIFRSREAQREESIALYLNTSDGDRTNFIHIFLGFFLSATGVSVNLLSRNVLRCREKKSDFSLVKL